MKGCKVDDGLSTLSGFLSEKREACRLDRAFPGAGSLTRLQTHADRNVEVLMAEPLLLLLLPWHGSC